MKKLISMMLCLVLMLGVTACTNNDNASTPTPPASSEEPTSTPTPSQAIPEPQAVKPAHVHTWAEATYQLPKTCTSCGETSGQPLIPGFVKLDYKLSELGTTYPYQSVCSEDPTITTTGEVAVTYETISGNDKYPAKDGYEWLVAHVKFRFFDDNAWEYGTVSRFYDVDYYGMVHDTELYTETPPDIRQIDWNGKDYDVEYKEEVIRAEWVDREFFAEIEKAFLVPVGYDGIVVACINVGNYDGYKGNDRATKSALLSDYAPDSILWFRLN